MGHANINVTLGRSDGFPKRFERPRVLERVVLEQAGISHAEVNE
jgi:hypothetical protein